jgi:hypothetical protein
LIENLAKYQARQTHLMPRKLMLDLLFGIFDGFPKANERIGVVSGVLTSRIVLPLLHCNCHARQRKRSDSNSMGGFRPAFIVAGPRW